jgi:hypothetical protein
MELDRRGFLGSVIGMLTASRLPFVAEATPTIIELTNEERARILLGYPISKLEKMIGVYHLPDGTIKSTTIQHVERTRNTVSFKLADWEAAKKFYVDGMSLITPDGGQLNSTKELKFHGGQVFMMPGDTLKGTLTISY